MCVLRNTRPALGTSPGVTPAAPRRTRHQRTPPRGYRGTVVRWTVPVSVYKWIYLYIGQLCKYCTYAALVFVRKKLWRNQFRHTHKYINDSIFSLHPLFFLFCVLHPSSCEDQQFNLQLRYHHPVYSQTWDHIRRCHRLKSSKPIKKKWSQIVQSLWWSETTLAKYRSQSHPSSCHGPCLSYSSLEPFSLSGTLKRKSSPWPKYQLQSQLPGLIKRKLQTYYWSSLLPSSCSKNAYPLWMLAITLAHLLC